LAFQSPNPIDIVVAVGGMEWTVLVVESGTRSRLMRMMDVSANAETRDESQRRGKD
jgi:hypothetical protein